MTFGLKQRDIDCLHKAFGQLPEIEQVLIFGSRAKGNARPGSDIDLAIKGRAVTDQTILRLRGVLEELPLPYFIDVIDYQTIDNADLLDHIGRVGEVLYQRS